MEETDWCENQKFCFGRVKFEWLFSHPSKGDQGVAIENENQGTVVSEKPTKEYILKDRNGQVCQILM